jgi:acetyltransferase-like isoleucine patch superfamily enzyme
MSIKNKIVNKLHSIFHEKDLTSRKFLLEKLIKKGVVEYGEYTYGTPNIQFDKYSKSKIKIGKFCSIAENVTIFNGSNHNTDWISTYPFRIMFDMDKKFKDGHPATKGDVIIGNDVWIGQSVTIYSGVNIGDGAIIAGNSVVIKNVESYSIVGGSPAKFIKYRFTEKQIDHLKAIKWWYWDIKKIKNAVPLLCTPDIDEFINAYDK